MFSGTSINGFRGKFKTERDCLQNILDKTGGVNSIFDKLITKMTKAKPVNYKMIKCELMWVF